MGAYRPAAGRRRPENTVYDAGVDDVVQEELAAEAEAAAAREAEQREAQRIAGRADELQALGELSTLQQTGPREGDEAVRDGPTRRAGSYVQTDVDVWFAHALAAQLGHYRDPAAGLLPAPVLGHAAPCSRTTGTTAARPRRDVLRARPGSLREVVLPCGMGQTHSGTRRTDRGMPAYLVAARARRRLGSIPMRCLFEVLAGPVADRA
ncbi:hypothetical protein PV735_29005 [Streptomyces turgidiscabies]|uniref:Uncharacterized protein n=1 Tax=Streptomyces turgidiscabies (strain Car8) TaxID=698760 RepID=L7FG32_STRT8|nr:MULTISPECIES: hypothetical protein [Streptomyces]ELP70119.1 hypothetical protein STRTUCAR8_10145 [Streptomyces turgidiscabies Car8]MDX3496694.1 hypothetical protein [Streptomyces turgidiscabies]